LTTAIGLGLGPCAYFGFCDTFVHYLPLGPTILIWTVLALLPVSVGVGFQALLRGLWNQSRPLSLDPFLMNMDMDVLAWYCVHPGTRDLFYQWHRENRIVTPHFFKLFNAHTPAFEEKNAQGLSCETLLQQNYQAHAIGKAACEQVKPPLRCKYYLDAIFGERLQIDEDQARLGAALPEAQTGPARSRRL
jgi:hypothetical protein